MVSHKDGNKAFCVKVAREDIVVIGYGSLMSGAGLLGVRRGGRTRLHAKDAFPVALKKVRRGLAKPSAHGFYLAMDLEPQDDGTPIRGRITLAKQADEIAALGLVFDQGWAEAIARREEYEPTKFVEILNCARRSGKSLGEFLFELSERAGHKINAYRTILAELVGYTSEGYIFHPVVLDESVFGIVAIGSGYEWSGLPQVVSRRRQCGIDRLLSLSEALDINTCQVDPIMQIGYLVECLLGSRHGLDLSDLLTLVEPDSEEAQQLANELNNLETQEMGFFLEATSLSWSSYRTRFRDGWSESIVSLLKKFSPQGKERYDDGSW